jgi:hypothetical protein
MDINLDDLRKYSKVIVSGCQRSGTTILAKMLSVSLGYDFVDEDDFGTHSPKRFNDELSKIGTKVIHAPAVSHILHRITQPNCVVLFVHRPYADIRRSMERIGWLKRGEETREMNKYKKTFNNLDFTMGIEELKPITWCTLQRPNMVAASREVEYGCAYMKHHPLWVKDEKRGSFKPKQTC